MREEAERLELRELGAHGRRRGREADLVGERLRPDRLPARDVLLDEAAENLLLAEGELHADGHLQGILAARAALAAGPSGEELGGEPSAQVAAALGERQRRAPSPRAAAG